MTERVRRFLGFDGEGMGDGAMHDYYVLRAGPSQLVTGYPLQPHELLDFIADIPPDVTPVVFAGNYDFTMILRRLPRETVHYLLHPELRARTGPRGTTIEPVRWRDYRIEYFPHKRLQVQRDDG